MIEPYWSAVFPQVIACSMDNNYGPYPQTAIQNSQKLQKLLHETWKMKNALSALAFDI